MAFCRNCGHEVHDTDNFCLYCGTATKDKTDNSSQSEQKRKESFDGEIKKCPYCGEILKSFETNCPTCGLELRNVSVANSVKELSNKIQLIEASKPRGKGIKSRICRAEIESQITNLISSFPIPNTKEDILEFMILASSNIDVSNVWIPKVEQAYAKAKSTLKTSEDFSEIDAIYINYQKRLKQKKWKEGFDDRLAIYCCVGVFVVLPLIVIIAVKIMEATVFPEQNKKEETRLETIVQEANEALSNYDYKLALRIVDSMKYDAHDKDRERWWGIKKESMIDEIIEEAEKAGIKLVRPTEEPTTDSIPSSE